MFFKFISTVIFFTTFITGSPVDQSAVTPTSAGNCPSGAFAAYGTNQCFQIFNDSKYFMDAEIYCTGLGGHLASIHNGFDNMLIAGMARKMLSSNSSLFTGGNNLRSQNNWEWIDQQPMDYTDFDFPLDDDPYKNCIQLFTIHGKWQTADCYTPAPFICEVPRV